MPTAVPSQGLVRVLVVDDDPVYRRILRAALEGAGAEVTATAGNLSLARQRVEQDGLDLVTIDVVLAGESGLDLLSWLQVNHPAVGALLVTSGTAAARDEVDGILLGAAGLVRKPTGPDAEAQLREALRRHITRLAQKPNASRKTVATNLERLRAGRPAASQHRCTQRELIAVGASTGGPPVLLDLLKRLPAGFDVPIVIAQHMSAEHIGHFAEHLARQSGRDVALAQDGEAIVPGRVYVAGYGKHLLVERDVAGNLRAVQSDAPPEHNCRPAVDPLFRSVAQHCGADTVGVVATGMGSDGALGAVALRERGVPVVVQDEKTSVVWGMPGATVREGGADVVAPGPELADWVTTWTRGPWSGSSR